MRKLKKYSFIFIILLIVIVYHHQILIGISDSKLSVIFAPDTQYILSVIEWNQYSLLTEPSSLYHLNYFYPHGYVTFYGHPLFGEAMVFIFLNSFLGINLINTYNIYLLLAFWIGGIGVFLLGREFLRSNPAGYIAASVFIFFPYMRQLANSLNIFSFFWIGFIFYYIVLFYNEGKWRHAFLAGFFIFLQGLFSIYISFFLLAVLLPVLLILLLVLRYIDYKKVLKFFAALAPFLLLLLLVFHPFITTIQDSNLKRDFDQGTLLNTSMLFRSSSQLYNEGSSDRKVGKVGFFPGFIIIVLALMALYGKNKRRIILLAFMLCQFILIFFLIQNRLVIPATILLALAVIQLVYYNYVNREEIPKNVRLLYLLFLSYSFIFFNFSLIFGGEFSLYGLLIKLVPQFVNFRYLYRGILILLPVLSVIVAMGFIEIIKDRKKSAVFAAATFIVLMGFENFAGYQMDKSNYFNEKKYSSIEKRADKVILELPIYKPGVGNVRNSRYTINSIFHFNYYVNGRTAYSHFGDNTTLFNMTNRDKGFPDRIRLKYLIEHHSVDYIIFNKHKRLLKDLDRVRELSSRYPDLCRVIDRSDKYFVLELSDRNKKREIRRTFSPFHLMNRKLRISLIERYSGRVSVTLGEGKGENVIQVSDSNDILISFPQVSPSISGEMTVIRFDRDVAVKGIRLVKKDFTF